MSANTDAQAGVKWLSELQKGQANSTLVPVSARHGSPEEIEILERAKSYLADFVVFRVSAKSPVAEALVYVDDNLSSSNFAEIHRRIWSWGGVPLVYRKHLGKLELYRCAHAPDFLSDDGGKFITRPYDSISIAIAIEDELAAWWNLNILETGALWDDAHNCEVLLSSQKSAHRSLVNMIRDLERDVSDQQGVLSRKLRRRLLVLTLLIAYLESRGILGAVFFGRHRRGAKAFIDVIEDGEAIVSCLDELASKFNGDVFTLTDAESKSLVECRSLKKFKLLIEGTSETSGQRTLWKLYSFRDLPVELISHMYEIFVENKTVKRGESRKDKGSVYTPPALARLMVEEVLDWERIDAIRARGHRVLDPACGSGIFLVEAFKRLVLHWRYRNHWVKPGIEVLQGLIGNLMGVDIKNDTIELAAFSLCLALCEALPDKSLRSAFEESTKFFPELKGSVLFAEECFFAFSRSSRIKDVAVVLGNPPFKSKIETRAAQRKYAEGTFPDKQMAYLFIDECVNLLSEGGALCMIQPYGFLYNIKTEKFRRHIFREAKLREILDFVSIRGLFTADTKIVVVVMEKHSTENAQKPALHAVFRRTGRASEGRGFDLDYYDIHWIPYDTVLEGDSVVWRTNLFGGGRVLDLLRRLRSEHPTLATQIKESKWSIGPGFIVGTKGESSSYIRDWPFMPSGELTSEGILWSNAALPYGDVAIERPRTKARFTAPLLLIRKHIDLQNAIVESGHLTYEAEVAGICAPHKDLSKIKSLQATIARNADVLRAILALSSTRAMTQKATLITQMDVKALPIGDFVLSLNDRILIADINEYYRDFIRMGESTAACLAVTSEQLELYQQVFVRQLGLVVAGVKPFDPVRFDGMACLAFGVGENGDADLRPSAIRKKITQEAYGAEVTVFRVVRIYERNVIILVKPDRARFWLRSIALRDADETVADACVEA